MRGREREKGEGKAYKDFSFMIRGWKIIHN
jgi:hypothetical protein